MFAARPPQEVCRGRPYGDLRFYPVNLLTEVLLVRSVFPAWRRQEVEARIFKE